MADTTTVIKFVDGIGAPQTQDSMLDGQGNVIPQFQPRVNSAPVSDSNPLPTYGPAHTPAAGTASIVAVGGTAVIAITGPVRGGYIANPLTAADQGIGGAEAIIVDPVNSPGSAPGAGNGTAQSIAAGSTWTLPFPIPAGVTVHVNAVTTGHKFTVVTFN